MLEHQVKQLFEIYWWCVIIALYELHSLFLSFSFFPAIPMVIKSIWLFFPLQNTHTHTHTQTHHMSDFSRKLYIILSIYLSIYTQYMYTHGQILFLSLFLCIYTIHISDHAIGSRERAKHSTESLFYIESIVKIVYRQK